MKTTNLLVVVVLLALLGTLARGQSLSKALDAPQLARTTGGAEDWFGQTRLLRGNLTGG